MENAKMKIGRLGEEAACRRLEALGHTIVQRNWRSGHLEVDIITIDGAGLHFVEVKSRVAPVAAEPEANVTSLKQGRIVAAAGRFLNSADKMQIPAGLDVFFDVVSVIFEGDDIEVNYFPQAYIPIYT